MAESKQHHLTEPDNTEPQRVPREPIQAGLGGNAMLRLVAPVLTSLQLLAPLSAWDLLIWRAQISNGECAPVFAPNGNWFDAAPCDFFIAIYLGAPMLIGMFLASLLLREHRARGMAPVLLTTGVLVFAYVPFMLERTDRRPMDYVEIYMFIALALVTLLVVAARSATRRVMRELQASQSFVACSPSDAGTTKSLRHAVSEQLDVTRGLLHRGCLTPDFDNATSASNSLYPVLVTTGVLVRRGKLDRAHPVWQTPALTLGIFGWMYGWAVHVLLQEVRQVTVFATHVDALAGVDFDAIERDGALLVDRHGLHKERFESLDVDERFDVYVASDRHDDAVARWQGFGPELIAELIDLPLSVRRRGSILLVYAADAFLSAEQMLAGAQATRRIAHQL